MGTAGHPGLAALRSHRQRHAARGAQRSARPALFSHRSYGGRRRRPDGPAQIIVANAIHFDHHSIAHGRAGRLALLSCLAYLSFHADHGSCMDYHRTSAHEHDSQRGAERGSG